MRNIHELQVEPTSSEVGLYIYTQICLIILITFKQKAKSNNKIKGYITKCSAWMKKRQKGSLYYSDINIRLIFNDLWLSNPPISVCSHRIIKNINNWEQHISCWKTMMCLMLQTKSLIQLHKSRITPNVCFSESTYCTDEWKFGEKQQFSAWDAKLEAKKEHLSQLFIKIKIWPPKNTKWGKKHLMKTI